MGFKQKKPCKNAGLFLFYFCRVQTENIILKTFKRLYSTQRFVLISLLFFLLVIFAKNLAISVLDSFEWYKKPAVHFLKLVELMMLILFALSLVAKIPYIRVPLITFGMSAFFLIGVEAACLVLYEYEHRPGSEEKVDEKNETGLTKHISDFFSAKKHDVVIPLPDEPESLIPATALGVETLPPDFEDKKNNNEPVFRKEDIAWHEWQEIDADLGYKNKPNAVVESKTWSYGIPNPRAFYHIDSLGRRMTMNELKSPRRKYALFFGCSVTFGVMVDDKQTMPSIYERIDTTVCAYNYGVQGYGTHHILALLENRNLRSEIKEHTGAAFYIYFPGHTNRALGDMDSYLSWNAEGPFYYWDGEKIVRRKNFKEGRKLVSRFYEFVPTTYIGRYFDLRFPGKLRAHHYRFGARLIEKAAKEYERQFGNSEFYVVLLPGWGNEIIPYLEELNIRYLDYDRLLNFWQDKYLFAEDNHPRPLLYKYVAEQLVKDTGK